MTGWISITEQYPQNPDEDVVVYRDLGFLGTDVSIARYDPSNDEWELFDDFAVPGFGTAEECGIVCWANLPSVEMLLAAWRKR